MKRLTPLLVIVIAFVSLSFAIQESEQDDRDIRQEEAEDYFDRWLKEDVRYIITDEERAVFNNLTTPEEKEQFIEQFWFRRDPDPRTSVNEFKEEHYRRIAYANEKFTSGDPGWLTDRGRVYIIHGEPDSIESRPSGGSYIRDIGEGGGVTSAYPFEIWRYRHIEGMGNEVELEFVDKTYTGKFELAVYPWEKDALLQMPGAGRTFAEEMGLTTRADRPAYMLGGPAYGAGNPNTIFRRYKQNPFQRYETVARAQAPTPLKFKDLKELVQIDISYDSLPFETYEDYFRLNDRQVLVPLTVRVKNSELAFQPSGDLQVAKIAIYGLVTSMSKRIVSEFEQEVVTSFRSDQLEVGLQKSSIYQKVLPLDGSQRYRLDLVVKDLQSGKVGVRRQAIIPPEFAEESLTGSSLVLSDYIDPLEEMPSEDEMFVLGDVKIRPNIHRIFSPEMPLGVYFQVYNVAFDQSTLDPALRITYRLYRDGQLLRMAVDEEGDSMQYVSSRRVVLIKKLSLQGLEPGRYKVELLVEDKISGQQVQESDSFTLVDAQKLALAH